MHGGRVVSTKLSFAGRSPNVAPPLLQHFHLHGILRAKSLAQHKTVAITTIAITAFDATTIDGVRDVGRCQVGVAQRGGPLGPCCTLHVEARRRTDRQAPSLVVQGYLAHKKQRPPRTLQ